LWAQLVVVLGALLMLFSAAGLIGGAVLKARYVSGVDQQNLLDPQSGSRRRELNPNRPINMLLVGIDSRPDSSEPVRSDSIILVHVPAGHDRAYLMSVPRDLLVEIPASPPGRPRATREKINGAFAYGAADGGGDVGGFQLLSRAISNFTGVRFDGAAIINFDGFKAVVKALGGVDMCVDHRVVSEHIGFDRNGQYLHPRDGGKPVVYEPGCRHFNDWQALDYVRQRGGLPDGDYGRQRNQQRFLKAMLKQAASRGVITDPRKLDAVIRAAGKALTFDGGGVGPADWAWSLRSIGQNSLIMVKTPGRGVGEGAAYQGEELTPVGLDLFAALRENRLDEFVLAHPELINSG
jgi:LCP family protein required for cell wall assembly